MAYRHLERLPQHLRLAFPLERLCYGKYVLGASVRYSFVVDCGDVDASGTAQPARSPANLADHPRAAPKSMLSAWSGAQSVQNNHYVKSPRTAPSERNQRLTRFWRMLATICRQRTPYVALDRMPAGRLAGCLVAWLAAPANARAGPGALTSRP